MIKTIDTQYDKLPKKVLFCKNCVVSNQRPAHENMQCNAVITQLLWSETNLYELCYQTAVLVRQID